MNIDYDDFTMRLYAERIKHKIMQNEMSKKVHMTSSHYMKCEKGYNRFSYYELRNMCSTEVNLFYCFTGKQGLFDSRYKELMKNADMELFVGCLQTIRYFANTRRKKGPLHLEWNQVFNELKYLVYVDIGLPDERNIFKSIRDYDDITQMEMAHGLGVDVKKLRDLETGKILPDSEIIFRMYSKYGISPSAFLRDDKCFREELVYLLDSQNGKVGEQLLLLVKVFFAIYK